MIYLIVFLVGLACGAGLAYHLAGVAALKARLAEAERQGIDHDRG
ncbi:MAG TPA: hypothetical protein VFV27_07715 [Nevskiaceae bacterium]|nr:hypothetical protein [Nevskiaceae bacterium]